jgi:hypothetical protein
VTEGHHQEWNLRLEIRSNQAARVDLQKKGLLSHAYGRRGRGDTIKLLEHPKASTTKRRGRLLRGRGNDPGYGNNVEDEKQWAIRSQVLRGTTNLSIVPRWMQFTD